jgi:hypothetical protein
VRTFAGRSVNVPDADLGSPLSARFAGASVGRVGAGIVFDAVDDVLECAGLALGATSSYGGGGATSDAGDPDSGSAAVTGASASSPSSIGSSSSATSSSRVAEAATVASSVRKLDGPAPRVCVRSHLSVYTHRRFCGVAPVGTSSRVPSERSACVACRALRSCEAAPVVYVLVALCQSVLYERG